MKLFLRAIKRRALIACASISLLGYVQTAIAQCVPASQAQVFSVAAGTNVSILPGTLFNADSLTLQPTSNFILTNNSLNLNLTPVNAMSNATMARVYTFGSTTNGFSGSLFYGYQSCELNGLTESNLRLSVHNGSGWLFYTNSSNDLINNNVSNTSLSNLPLNELSLGTCIPITAAAIVTEVAEMCKGYTTNLRINITGGTAPYTVVYKDGNNTITLNNYQSGTPIAVSPSQTNTYTLVSVTSSTFCEGTGIGAPTVLTINNFPVIEADNGGSACVGSELSLSVTAPIGCSFQWQGPNGFTSTSQNPTIANATLAAEGLYAVQATLRGCTSYQDYTYATINKPEQVYAVNEGTTLSVIGGTLFNADKLTLQPTENFAISNNSFSRNLTATNTFPANAHVSRVYKFSSNTSAFSGSTFYDYQDCELKGLLENNLRLGIHNGDSWKLYANSVKDASSNTVSIESVSAMPLNELLVGTCVSSTAAVLSRSGSSTAICAAGSANLTVAITGGIAPFTIVLNDGTKDTSIINYTSGSHIVVHPSQTNTYTLVSVTGATGCDGLGNTGNATVTVNPPFNPGSISTTGETICYEGIPEKILGVTEASGGDGNISYEWRSDMGLVDYTIPRNSYLEHISGLETTTTYTRFATDGTCNLNPTQSSGSYTVTVLKKFYAGAIQPGDQTICYGQTPATMRNNYAATGGDGNISYKWQYQDGTDGNIWKDIPNSNVLSYTPTTGLTRTTSYRRLVKDGFCNVDFVDEGQYMGGVWVPAVNIKITVKPQFLTGSIAANPQEICYNTIPSTIYNQNLPTGSDGTFQYKWKANGVDMQGSSESFVPYIRLTETTTFTRWVRDPFCSTDPAANDFVQSEGAVIVTVKPAFNQGAIGRIENGQVVRTETICEGGFPSEIGNITDASGGDGLKYYQWRKDGSIIPGQIGATLRWQSVSQFGLSNRTTFVREAKDGTCNTFDNSSGTPEAIVYVVETTRPNAPTITFSDNCGNSTLTASNYTGSILWTTNVPTTSETYGWATPVLTTTQLGTYSVTQTINGCTSLPAYASVSPKPIPVISNIVVRNECNLSTLYPGDNSSSGTYLWSNGGTSLYLEVSTAGNYSLVITNEQGCESLPYTATAAPKQIPLKPTLSVVNNCGSSTITVSNYTGQLKWTDEGLLTVSSRVVTGEKRIGVSQIVEGCESEISYVDAKPISTPSTPIISQPLTTIICSGSGIPLVTPNLGAGYSYVWRKDAVVITGQSTNSINITEAGSYDISVSKDGCESLTSLPQIFTASANPLPAKPSITADGPTTFCSQDQTQVTLTATGLEGNTGVWTDIRTNAFGTRVYEAPFVAVQESALFELRAKNNEGCLSIPATIEVIKKQSPSRPTITGDPALVNGAITICSGSTVNLTASESAGNTYVWNNEETIRTIKVNSAAAYTVRAISPNGCSSLESDPALVYVTQVGTPSISASSSGATYVNNNNGTVSTCSGGTITLTSTVGSTYLWSNGATTRSIDVSEAGSYTVQVTNVEGCLSASSSSITVVVRSLPVVPTASVINNCDGSSTLTASNFTGSLKWNNVAGSAEQKVYQAGSYSVTQIVDGCESPASNIVVATPGSIPTAGITNNTTDPIYYNQTPIQPTTVLTCNTLSIGVTATGGTSYSWTGPNNFTAITATTQFTQPGTYTVTVTNAAGCSDTKSIEIIEDKRANVPVISGQTELTCLSPSIDLFASGGSSYSWNAGAGVLNNSSNTVTSAGTYTVTATDALTGCTASASVTVTENKEIITKPTIQVDNRCDGTAWLTATATGIHTAGFQWKIGNELVSSSNPIRVENVNNVTYSVTQSFGACTSEAASVTVSTRTAPTAAIAMSNSGSTLNCTYPSVGVTASGGASYSWTGPNDFTANTAATSFTKPGRYTVVVTAENGCTDSEFIDITEDITKPTISIVNNTGSTVVDCLNPSIQVSATGSFTNGNQLIWSGGANTTGIENSFTQPGTYTLTATDPINGCSSTASITITQGTALAPVAGITNNTGSTEINCTNAKISVTATGVGNYAWSNGATTAANEFTSPGTYVLTVTNEYGCTDTKEIIITKNINQPVFSYVTPSDYIITCKNPAVTISINSASSSNTYSWSGGTPSADGKSATFSAGGTYTITATGDNGCTSTETLVLSENRAVYPVTFNNALAPQLVTSTTYKLSGGTSDYMVGTGDYSGPGVTKSSTINGGGGYDYNFNASVAGVGTHTITFTTTSPQTGCTNTATNTITVYPAVDVTFNGVLASQCISSNTYTLTGGSPAGGTYSGNGVTGNNFNASVAGVGTHTITYTYNDPVSGFTLTATKDINVYALNDLAPLTGAQELCVGATTLFSASLPGGIWSSNNTDIATVEAGLVRGMVEGTAIITYDLDNGVCPSSTVIREVTVHSIPNKPTITAGENRVVCSGETVSMVSSSEVNNQWYFNGDIIPNATGKTYLASATGSYTVKVISNGCEGAASDAVAITVNEGPTVADITGGATVICAGTSTTFENATPGGTWSSSNELVATVDQQGKVIGVSGGIVTIYYTKSANGCTTSVSTNIQVNPTPVVTLNPNALAVCEGSSTLFFASITGGVWSSSDESIATVTDNGVYANMQHAVVSGLKAGTANITYTVISFGCSASVSKTFTVNAKLPLSVSIASDATNNTICDGSRVIFTATPTNAGSSLMYKWKNGANDINGAIGDSYISSSLQNNDEISVELTSTGGCISGSPAISNVIKTTVNPTLNPSVTIQSDALNNSICKGSTINFSATPVNGGAQPQYRWLVNGSTASTISIFSTAALKDGDQVTLTMVADELSCRTGNVATSNTIPVAVNSDIPSVTIASDKQYNAVCAGSAITFTATPLNGGLSPTYQWYVGENKQVGEISVNFTSSTLTQGDKISVQITSNGEVCLNGKMATSNEVFVYVGATYTPSVSLISTATNNTICAGASVQFTANPLNGGNAPTYKWFVNDVQEDASAAVFTTSSLTQGSKVKVEMTSNYVGCLSTSTAMSTPVEMTVVSIPTAPTTTDVSRCGEGDVVLQATAPAGATVYWFTAPSGGISLQSNTVFVSASRTYYAESRIGTCVSATRTPVLVTVNVVPARPSISTTTATSFCSGGSVVLTSSSAEGNQWYNNGVIIEGSTEKTYTATKSGIYTVVKISEPCSSIPSLSVQVIVYETPAKPSISAASALSFCSGGSVELSSFSETGRTKWYLDGVYIPSSELQQKITASVGGSYTLQVDNLISTSPLIVCSSQLSDAVIVTVNPTPAKPTIQSTGSTTFCKGGSVLLTSSSAEGNQWYENGTIIQGSTGQTYTATAGGNYTVKVTLGTCTSEMSDAIGITVPVLEAPSITAGSATSFCVGGSVVLTSSYTSVQGYSNRWYLNGQPIDFNSTAQTYTATLPGTYSVTLLQYGTMCESEASAGIVVTVKAKPEMPTISASGETTFCAGGSVILSSSFETGNQWYLDGVAITTNGDLQTYTATQSGTYTIRKTVDGCEGISNAVVVTANALPSIAPIQGNTSICLGFFTTLTTSTSGGEWSSSNTAVATVNQLGTVFSASAGTTTITYTIQTPFGCEGKASVVVTVGSPVIAEISGPSNICIGTSIKFTNATAGGVWSSYNPSVATVALDGTVTGVGEGDATLKYTISIGEGCSAEVTKLVTVSAIPGKPEIISGSQSLTFCEGGSENFSSTSAGVLQWFKDGIALSTGNTISATESGSYTVQSTVNGCVSEMSDPKVVTVVASPKPTITASGATTVCEGTGLTLTSSAAAGNQWYLNGDPIENANGKEFTPLVSGNYTVRSVTGPSCATTMSDAMPVTIKSSPKPGIYSYDDTDYDNKITICPGESTTLLLAAYPPQVQWYKDGVAITAYVNDYSYVATETGVYTVKGINDGCSSVASNPFEVTVNALPVVTINGNQEICIGSTTTLAAVPTVGLSYWFSSNTSVASINNSGLVTGLTAGETTIRLEFNYNGCVGGSDYPTPLSASKTITVVAKPVVAPITGSGVVVIGTSTSLTSGTEGGTWSSADETIATVSNGEVSGLKVGTTTIYYSVGGEGCKTTVSKEITVISNDGPSVSITSNDLDNEICAGKIVIFTAAATNAGTAPTYQWKRNGNNVGTNNITYTVSNLANNDVVIVVVTVDPSLNSSALPITSNEIKTKVLATETSVTILSSDLDNTICAGTEVTFTAQPTNGGTNPTYQWSVGMDNVGSNSATFKTSTLVSGDVVSLNMTSNAACLISPSNQAGNSITTTVNPVTSHTTTISECGSYKWTSGNGQTYTISGTYTYVNGCHTETLVLTINAKPATPQVSVTDNCDGKSTLTAINYTGTLLWNTEETTQSIIVTSAGTYTVTQTVNGCVSDAGSGVAAPKTAPATPVVTVVNNCNGTYTLSTTAEGMYSWSNGSEVLGQSATLNVTTQGTYTVTVTGANGCTATANQTITQDATAVSASINSTVTTVLTCSTTSIDLTATGEGSYSWGNGNDVVSTGATLNVTAPGTYTVTVTGANGCTATASKIITQDATAPSASINSPATTVLNCSTTTIDLTATGGESYSWSNGISVVGTSATLSVTIPGTYTVTVTGANGCSATASKTITQDATAPSASINSTVTTVLTCSTTSIDLTATGGESYSWSNAISVVGTSATLSVTTPGTYTVTVTGANGCIATANQTITQDIAIPSASINSPATTVLTCSTISIDLTATGGEFYSWSNGNVVVGNSATLSVTTLGTYTVTVTSANGCSATASKTITQDATAPSASINSPVTTVLTCSTTSIDLTAIGEGTYSWSNGMSVVGTSATISVTTPGTYTVTVTGANGCTDAKFIEITQDVTKPLTPSVNVVDNCNGTSTLTAINYTGTLLWNTEEITPSITVSSSGTYTVTQTVDGCTSDAGSGTASPKTTPTTPTITSGGATSFCQNGSVVLTSSSDENNQWYLDGNILFGSTGKTYTATSSGKYTLKVIVNGCESEASAFVEVTVNPLPQLDPIQGSIYVCIGAPATFTSNISGGTWTIDNGDLATITSSGLVTTSSGLVTGLSSGSTNINYTVQSAGGCSSTVSMFIQVNERSTKPTINTNNYPTEICEGGYVYMTSSAEYGNQWYLDNNPIGNNSSIYGYGKGIYTLKVNANGCESVMSDGVEVKVKASPAKPTISSNNVATFCAGQSVVLSSSSATGNQWFRNYSPINTNGTGQTFTATEAGSYTAQVIGENGCSSPYSDAIELSTIPAPAAPAAEVTVQPDCITPTGTITAIAGGTQHTILPYGSYLDFETGNTYDWSAIWSTPGLDISGSIWDGVINISSAEYGVTRIAPTTKALNDIVLDDVSSMTFENSQITPEIGKSFVVKTGASNYFAVKVVSSNDASIELDWKKLGEVINYSIDGENYTNTTGVFENVQPGTYQVTVKNPETGCVSPAKTVTVNAPAGSDIAPTASVTDQPTCSKATGTITVTAPANAAGVTYTVTVTSPVVAAQSNSTGIFTGLVAGIYNVTTTANGCTSTATVLTINAQIPFTAVPAQPTELACYQSVGTFNTGTCQWNIVGEQPAQPTNLACYESVGTFNTGTCQWNIVGTAPALPNAGTDGTLISDSNPTNAQLFAALTGADEGGSWSHPAVGFVGVHTYTVTQAAPCSLSDSATVTVTAASLGAPVVENTSMCKGDLLVSPSATALPGYTLVWYKDNLPTTKPLTLTTAAPVITKTITYWVAQKLGAGTPSQRASVTVTVNELPATPSALVLTNGLEVIKKVGNFIGTTTELTLTATAADVVSPAAATATYNWTLPTTPTGVSQKAGEATNGAVITVKFAGVTAANTAIEFLVKSVSAEGCPSKTAKKLTVTRSEPGKPKGLVLTDATDANASATPPVLPIVVKKLDAYTGALKGRTLTLTVTPETKAGSQASSYKWVLPAAATTDAAHFQALNADNVLVDVPNTYTSTNSYINITLGEIATETEFLFKVYGVNKNGTSLLSKDLTLKSAAAKTPGSITSGGVTPKFYPGCTATPTLTVQVPSVLGVTYAWKVNGASVSGSTNSIVISTAGVTSTTIDVEVTASNGYGASTARILSIKKGTTTCATVRIAPEAATAIDEFKVIAYPNPSSTNFNLNITTSSAKNVEVKVYDMIGKLINKMEVSPSKVAGLQIGDRYPSGVYNVIVSQGTEVKTLRVIKQ